MRKSSLFADKNRAGKGDWVRKHDKKKVDETIDRVYGEREPIDFQTGKRTKKVYSI